MTVVGGWVAVLIFLAVFVYGRGMTPVERPRYDITLVQEIRDSSETALPLLDIMIAGDFNADCTYVSRKEERKEISLFTDKRFEWLIGADLDTTVGDSDCSYDRFVVAGRNLKSAILPGTVGVYNFHKKHNLTAEEAKEVSDHYPIELSLQGREHTQVTEGKRVGLGLGFTESNQVDKDDIQKLYTSREDLEDIGFTVRRYKEENRNELYVVTKTCKNRLEVLLDLYSFRIANSRKSFENLITKEQLAMVEQFLISDYSDILKPPPHVNGLTTKVDDNFTVEIRCRISETKCELDIKRLIF
ncbi:hypothetical protein KUTeg_015067 [Tegillarca granosa]|uniref:Endonuclease/exonuclease/phosphatase domain-containing protein n=1 Tax=Tegillarca granosa TaxID=220873 RepID=A0ABQ9EP22_TEGGR|nr:hypothetical protein KUTeg_015067 [Tegillarca granosa]